MTLNYTITEKPLRYLFKREEDNIFLKGQLKNSLEAVLEVQLKLNPEGVQVFNLKMLNYKQSNNTGMYQWVNDLHFLRHHVEFTLDNDFQLGEIENLNNIQRLYSQNKPKLTVKNSSKRGAAGIMNEVEKILKNPQRFAHNLRFAHPYITLFSGVYGKELNMEKEAIGYRELPNFIHIKKVPIITYEKLGVSNENFQEVEVNGKLDKENFEQEKLTQFIQVIKNRPRVPTLLKLNYTERYKIGLDTNWPELAMCMSLAQVPGTLYQSERTMIKRID